MNVKIARPAKPQPRATDRSAKASILADMGNDVLPLRWDQSAAFGAYR
jgi:hypothetical protein